MSYQRGLSGSGFGDLAVAAQSVAEDPCLFRTSKLLRRLSELEAGGAVSAGTATKGIGMCSMIGPLELAVTVKERPWLVPLVGAAVVAGLLGLGFAAGRAKRRSR